MRCFSVIATSLFFVGAGHAAEKAEKTKFSNKRIKESSGVVASSKYPGVFWTHNDSGDTPRLFAFRGSGKAVEAKNGSGGIAVEGALAVDWEDITKDDKGHLIIADVGNNFSFRQDLTVYFVAEPNPEKVTSVKVVKKLKVHFEDQKSFLPRSKGNFDCESVFMHKGKLLFLTKNRGDHQVNLYGLKEVEKLDVSNALVKLDSYNIKAQATAADVSSDGKWLAVLTYGAVWLFELDDGQQLLQGKKYRCPVKKLKQSEGICFIGNELVITNEQADVLKLKLEKVKQKKYRVSATRE